MQNNNIIEIQNVSVKLSDKPIVENVNLNLSVNEKLVIIGKSGCGKSTLLRAIGGFLPVTSGKILIKGQAVTKPSPNAMMVFQESEQLFPWKKVLDNVAFPLVASGKLNKKEASEKAAFYLEKVALMQVANSYPYQLSGGMKQRVAIARALAMEPALLLMDEPFSALDHINRRKLQDEVLRLWNEIKFTMVFITHSVEEAIILGDKVVLFTPHPAFTVTEFSTSGFDHTKEETMEFVNLKKKLQELLV